MCAENQMCIRRSDSATMIRPCTAQGPHEEHVWGEWKEVVPTSDPAFVEIREPSKPAATEPKAKTKRGFAAMDKRSLRKLARQGGQAAHAKGVAPTFTKETAREAGKKGGNTTAQDREHMREIGRKGGTSVSRDPEHMSRIGKVGGPIGAARRWGKSAAES